MFRKMLQTILVPTTVVLALALFAPAFAHAQTSSVTTALALFGGTYGKYGTTAMCAANYGSTNSYELDCNDALSSGAGFFTFSSDGTIHPYAYPGNCLDLSGNMLPCNGSQQQQWYFLDGVIQTRWRGNSGCLSAGIPATQGIILYVQPCNQQMQQVFIPTGVSMTFENPSNSSCLYYSTAPNSSVGSEPCNSADPAQAFFFTFGSNVADSENGFYTLLEASTSSGSQCVTYSGTWGDDANLDPNCNTSSYDGAWEFWRYTADYRLENAQTISGQNTCLNVAEPGSPTNAVTEQGCAAAATPQQTWYMWINGFPYRRLPTPRA